MNDGNDVEVRRARLRALRERYEQTRPASADSQTETGLLNDDAEPAQVLVPVRRRAPKPVANDARRQAAGGLVQRVATFLSQTGPGARFIAGTNIREDRLGQLVQFLKRRSAAANGQQAQRARSILTYLTGAAPGERMVTGVNIARAQLLLERAGDKTPQVREVAVVDGDAETFIEGDALALQDEEIEQVTREVMTEQTGVVASPATNRVDAESLPELVERAQRLSEELLAVQQQICERVTGRRTAESPVTSAPKAADPPVSSARPQEGRGEWFMDFLE